MLVEWMLAAISALPTEAEVRAQARGVLEPLCRGRCDVVEVEIKTRPAEPRGAAAPGFEDLPEARLALSEIQLTVLFDQRLDARFRQFASERLTERVGELGRPVKVSPKIRLFPDPPDPLESPPPPPPPPEPEPLESPPPPPPPEPEAPPSPDYGDLALRRVLEVAPLFLLFGLLAWLVLRVLRRLEDLVFDLRAPVPAPAAPASPPQPKAPEPVLPPPTMAAVKEGFQAHRASARRVVRRLLLAGEHETVARAVAVLGEQLVQDLGRDPELRPALLDTGRRAAEQLRTPITEAERDELLRVLEAELLADRIAHGGDDGPTELAPMLGFGPEAFASFVAGLDDRRLALLALRHGPAHLTEAFLRGLDDGQRAALVAEAVEAPAGTPEELRTLAEEVHRHGAAAELSGFEADHLIELLDSLPADAQDRLLDRLEAVRPEFVRRSAGRLPVESSLRRVPLSALSAAWNEVPLEAWIAYLRVAPADIRARAFDACPNRLRPAVQEELDLRVPADPDAARAARRRVVAAAVASSA